MREGRKGDKNIRGSRKGKRSRSVRKRGGGGEGRRGSGFHLI